MDIRCCCPWCHKKAVKGFTSLSGEPTCEQHGILEEVSFERKIVKTEIKGTYREETLECGHLIQTCDEEDVKRHCYQCKCFRAQST